MKRAHAGEQAGYLGIEAGGTRTTARFESLSAERIVERAFAPANLRLLDDSSLRKHFRSIAHAMPSPAAVAIGMAGARTENDRRRIRTAAANAWPGVPCEATNDLETALMAAECGVNSAGNGRTKTVGQVLVLSGTGSCCFGRASDGRTAKVGGWGHILGDKGSAYEIGLRALKAAVYYHDRDDRWSLLGRRILRALMLNEPNDLIDWVRSANKDVIARLAIEVFHSWADRDRIAKDIVTGAANSLASDAAACARRLWPRGGRVLFVLAGGVLMKQPRFAGFVRRELKRRWPEAIVTTLRRSGAEGAVRLAREFSSTFEKSPLASRSQGLPNPFVSSRRRDEADSGSQTLPPPRGGGYSKEGLPPTERRNPRSMRLDRMPTRSAINLMLSEEAGVTAALRAERRPIEHAIELIVRSLRRGGRLFYVGAGTSGRLGVLDASECPPTFRTPPDLVQGIIAGGQPALWSATEGAEDDPEAGARAIRFRGVDKRDTVVGIAASGRTPFVWGALDEARRAQAATILLCFNPELVIPARRRPTVVIAPAIGPEVLTGSTRLKAGTATKLVLNMFTTLSMVRVGKVRSNLMIDVRASNAKLRDRAIRIVVELTGASPDEAQRALVRRDWKIVEACAVLQRKLRKVGDGEKKNTTKTAVYSARPRRNRGKRSKWVGLKAGTT